MLYKENAVLTLLLIVGIWLLLNVLFVVIMTPERRPSVRQKLDSLARTSRRPVNGLRAVSIGENSPVVVAPSSTLKEHNLDAHESVLSPWARAATSIRLFLRVAGS